MPFMSLNQMAIHEGMQMPLHTREPQQIKDRRMEGMGLLSLHLLEV
jgi:hypothetical protein